MQKTKYDQLLEVLPINIGDKVYYCTRDSEDEVGGPDMPQIPFRRELTVVGILQAPKENDDCDPIFILYDPKTNLAYVRMAVWFSSLILQTEYLMNNPELCASIVRQYESLCKVAYHV